MNEANEKNSGLPAVAGGAIAMGGGKYSRLQLAQKYVRYILTASNGKGHGIHSPFVFNFVKKVLNDAGEYPAYAPIEKLRLQLEKDPAWLEIEDMGAGPALKAARDVRSARGGDVTQEADLSRGMQVSRGVNGMQGVIPEVPVTRRRSVADLARQAAKPRKLGQLLFRMARYYQADTILELGTSLGLSTAYLATGGVGRISEGFLAGAKVFTIEGAPAVAAVAEKNFRSLGLENVELTVGNFDRVLEGVLDRAGTIDLVFIDGNHRLEPTLRYFNRLMGSVSRSSVLIFDDIHWSEEMEEAWETIKRDTRVYLTIDLFFIGLVFFREEFKVKQDFSIRF